MRGVDKMKVLAFSHSMDLVLELISAGRELGDVSLIMTSDQEGRINEVKGAKEILLCKGMGSGDQEGLVELISGLAGEYEVVLLASDRRGRELVGQVAHRLGASSAVDVSSLSVEDGKLVVERMTFGGKAIAVEELGLPAVISVQKGKFKPPEEGEPSVREISAPSVERRIEVIERKEKPKVGVPLDKAEIVVAVGRGFRKKEDLKLAYELADVLGGVVGATRPIAADLKWMEEEVWIGISGVRIAPKLLIVVGASGQQQFAAGIMDSKVVVAVNTDSKAPIFEQADYGVVMDLYEFLPVLTRKLKEIKGG
ncbi:MAG: electron transfer flavoprotein subunit alpha/FixB family protein [Candidatus Korarchaeota archaeon]|nr:electron transfer flavoprotein subunit alpha/FixB family protein [Candidatus Korarchaeota archaeon]